MDRRRFVAMIGSALAAPLGRAQAPGRIWRIGFLGIASASGYVRELDWIRDGLRRLGYVEGRNLAIEYRWAEGSTDRLRDFTAEFVQLRVDAILTHALPGAIVAARVTSKIPIVMADGGDPVAADLADSLARPGRNVTGSTSFILEEIGKRLQLLHEIVPRMRRIAFLSSTADIVIAQKRKAIEAAAASLKLEMRNFTVREPADLPEAFIAMTDSPVDAAVINNEPLLNANTRTVAGLASVKRLPSVGYASYADAGGLLAYGANRSALYGRAGYFLDRIFKGEKPGEIPFERAAKFDTVVNLKTARALGLAIPQSFLLRADRVIE